MKERKEVRKERRKEKPERRKKKSNQKNRRKIKRALCHGGQEFQGRNYYKDQMRNIGPRDVQHKMAIGLGDLEVIDDLSKLSLDGMQSKLAQNGGHLRNKEVEIGDITIPA